MTFHPFKNFADLEKKVTDCRLCPRLVQFRENVPPVKAFENEKHWRKPVSGWGDPGARLLILGLAPSSQGGNRTGRIFTGDPSGRFLFRLLHKEGFANQPTGESKDDGLKLHDCYITAAVKCTPPHHKPKPEEFRNCFGYLINEIFLLERLRCVLALGKDAFQTYLKFLKLRAGVKGPFPAFSHGKKIAFAGWPQLYASYHPTPQNVNTGRLTEKMFSDVLKRIKKDEL